jgi:hypothetical protein
MTFKEDLLGYLTSNGMFDSDALSVFEAMKADPANAPMSDRWNDSTDNYPAAMRAILHLAANRAALAFIDEHLPKAWFRPMFTDSPEAEIARLQAGEGSI